MARKLSVDLELNAKGYTQGINEAKNATAQYTNATVDLKKETEDYLSQFGSLRKQLRGAKQEAFNLAVQFSQLSKTEKDSEIGQQLAGELQFAIEKAAELEDVMSDTNDAIRKAASDTAGLDAFKESLDVGKDIATAYIGVLGKLTGSEEALKNAVSSLAIVQGSFNAVIKTTNMLQKNSATMIALQRAGVLSLAQAHKVSEAAAKASTIAMKGLGAVMKAVPYLAIAAAISSIVIAIAKYRAKADEATEATKKLKREMHDASIQGKKDAQADITKLKLLYDATQNLNLKKRDRIKAVKDLQKIYPAYFGNLTQEEILAGKASDAYKQLANDIIACAQARAYEKRINDIAEQNVDLEDQIEKQKERVEQYRKAAEEAKKASETATTNNYDNTATAAAVMYWKKVNAQYEEEKKKLKDIENQKTANIAQQNKYLEAINATTAAVNRLSQNNETTKSSGSKTELKTEAKTDIGILPKANKVNKQIDDWFKAYDNKIAAKTKEASEMNYNVVGPSINILNSPQDIQGAENAIQQALQVDDIEFDFSSLPEAMQEAAEEAAQSLDRLAEAMAIAGQQRANFLAAGDTKGVEEMDKQLSKLTEDYNKQSEEVGKYVKRSEEVKNLSDSFQSVGDSVGALGGLFSALGDATDDAGMKTMGIIAETLATMALSFAKALKSCTTWYEWVAFGITGMTQLVSMVSQIKQLTAGGYAEGGIIPGNSFAGDKVMAMVNSGEMILNTHQQKNLFDMLNGITGTGISSSKIELTGKIRGKDLLLVQKNYNTIGSKSGQSIKIN